jgi:hypothetical protein
MLSILYKNNIAFCTYWHKFQKHISTILPYFDTDTIIKYAAAAAAGTLYIGTIPLKKSTVLAAVFYSCVFYVVLNSIKFSPIMMHFPYVLTTM